MTAGVMCNKMQLVRQSPTPVEFVRRMGIPHKIIHD